MARNRCLPAACNLCSKIVYGASGQQTRTPLVPCGHFMSETPPSSDETIRTDAPGTADETVCVPSGAPSALRQSGQVLFARFRLERLLGKGAMGEVWLAQDTRLSQLIALKFLPESTLGDKEALQGLAKETRRSRELTHPHIVRVHDFESDERTGAIAMEYVDGDSLASLRQGQPGGFFEVRAISQWVRQLCEALDYAHVHAHIVHRDLKPANIMIGRQGDLKVMDFGISASIADSESKRSMLVGVSGTPLYMSPQQRNGERPSERDDIYSLGATIYELLTGKPPFYTGDLHMQIVHKVPPRMAARRAELEVAGEPIPEVWETVVAQCLAKETGQRPASVRVVAERLGLLAPAHMQPPPPISVPASLPKGGSRWWLWALGGVGAFALLLVAGIILLFVLADDGASATPPSISPPAVPAEKPFAGPRQAEGWTVPGLQLELVAVPAGAFTMGSTSGDATERPLTYVTLTQPFWLGKYEVTQEQWQTLMHGNPAQFRGDRHPVEKVSWLDAMDFCRRLTERERAAGRLPAGYRYVLPTEAQWEYACRAGGEGEAADAYPTQTWHQGNSGNTTQPVGGKVPNDWGLYDMHGNVWEWCLDWKTSYPGGEATDPRGPASGQFRIFRGGGWNSSLVKTRATTRVGAPPEAKGFEVGFRVALSRDL